jgi:hypothetical protein
MYTRTWRWGRCKKTVVVCRLGLDSKGHKVKEIQTFGTTTAELLRVSDWLTAGACTMVPSVYSR